MKRTLLPLLFLSFACEPPAEPPAPAPEAPPPPRATRAEFELVDKGFAVGTSPLRARWDLDSAGGTGVDRERMSVGDFYARLVATFGAPQLTDDKGFSWVLREKKSGLILTAHSRGAGPQYGGGYRVDDTSRGPPAPEAALSLIANTGREPPGFGAAVARLDEVLAAADLNACPAPCEVSYVVEGTILRSGARAGRAFDEALDAEDALAWALSRVGPPTDALLDEDADRALDLWAALDEGTRASRAVDGEKVGDYWRRAVTRLAAEPAQPGTAQLRALRWSQLWRTRVAAPDDKSVRRLNALKPKPWPPGLEVLNPSAP